MLRHLPNIICLVRIALIWPTIDALYAGRYWTALILVAVCAVYTLGLLLPGSLKRRAAQALMARFPRLQRSARLQKLAAQGGGCGSGCDSCGSNPAKRPTGEHKVQFFRRH